MTTNVTSNSATVIFSVLAALMIAPALAVDAPKNVTVSGFLTAAATKGDNKKDSIYASGLAADDVSFSTRDTRFGLQISADVDPSIQLVSQLISSGGDDNFDLVTDWAFVKYKATEHLSIHAGKFKLPLFVLSDYVSVGYAYPWVRPPQEVYSINPLTSLTGINFLANTTIGDSHLLLQFYYGSGLHDVFIPARAIDLNDALPAEKKGELAALNTAYMVGASVELRSDALTFRLGHFETEVDVDEFGIKEAKGSVSSAGFVLDWQNLVVYSEYVLRDADSDIVTALADQKAWYATFGYRFGKLLPYITYAEIDEGKDKHILAVQQNSTALGLRYELASSTALKFEAMKANPEEGNHGLFNDPVESGKVFTVTMDLIF